MCGTCRSMYGICGVLVLLGFGASACTFVCLDFCLDISICVGWCMREIATNFVSVPFLDV